MDVIRLFFQFIFYPLRLIWSRYFYPPQAHRHKTVPNELGEYIIKTSPGSKKYLLLVPGVSIMQFDPDYIEKGNLFNLKELQQISDSDYNIMVIPPPCYRYRFTCFSLEKWAEAIKNQIEFIREVSPANDEDGDGENEITCLGISAGGAAVALAAHDDPSGREKYVIVNTFSSLSKMIWHESWISFLSFFIHFIPITLILLFVGLQYCSITYIVGLSALITALATLIFSSVYMHVESFFTNLYHQYSYLHMPQYILRQPENVQTAFRWLCKFAHFILLIFYKPTHYIAHGFTYFQLWLLECTPLIYKQDLGPNCYITQARSDAVIPEPACLLSAIDGSRSKRTWVTKSAHGIVPHDEISKLMGRG